MTYNNTYQSTIKMKPVDLKYSAYVDFGIEHNNKDPKSKVGDTLYLIWQGYDNLFNRWIDQKYIVK